LTIDAVLTAGDISSLDLLVDAFKAQFAFDLAQKWRYLSEFFKTKQDTGKKWEDFIRRVQEAGLKTRANEEQIRNTIIEGLLPHIQTSVLNDDIEPGVVGLASINKWSVVAENFPPVAAVLVDSARLQRQIEEFLTKLESTQMWVVSERQQVQFTEAESPSSRGVTRERSMSPESPQGRNQDTRSGVQSFLLNLLQDVQLSDGECLHSRSADAAVQRIQRAPDNWQSVNQRGDAPRYQSDRQQQMPYDRQSYNRFNNRGVPRRGMQLNFYRSSGGERGGYNNFLRHTMSSSQIFFKGCYN